MHCDMGGKAGQGVVPAYPPLFIRYTNLPNITADILVILQQQYS